MATVSAHPSFGHVDSAADRDGERIVIYERPTAGEMTQRYITSDLVLDLEDCR